MRLKQQKPPKKWHAKSRRKMTKAIFWGCVTKIIINLVVGSLFLPQPELPRHRSDPFLPVTGLAEAIAPDALPPAESRREPKLGSGRK